MSNMQISSSDNRDGSPTPSKTALFVRFLVKICFFPISVKKNKLQFSVISLRTMVYIFLSLGNIVAKFSISYYFYPEEFRDYLKGRFLNIFFFHLQMYPIKLGAADFASNLLATLLPIIGTTFPLILSSGMKGMHQDWVFGPNLSSNKKAQFFTGYLNLLWILF